jgi:peptidoglycan/xylan/chitin deacetylase (PgdA/CDA1 family)
VSLGAARHPVVLAYHSIHDPEPGVYAPDVILTPAALEHDVRELQANGYRFVTAAELGGEAPPPGTAVLTFDDGWRDGLTVAAPLLARLRVRATFYLCPGLFGNHDARMGTAGWVLTEAQARELHAAGMDLGAHSMTHPDLRTLDDDALRAELADSKAAIEAITGSGCRTLAYPFGVHDARVRQAAGEAGFALAFAYRPGPWSALAAPRLPGPLSGPETQPSEPSTSSTQP